MKNFFKEFQQTQQGFLQNPMSYAGLLVAGGRNYDDALMEAAKMQREQEILAQHKAEAEFKQQQALQQMQLKSRLANTLRGQPNLSRAELGQLALEHGVEPQNLGQFVEIFNPKPKYITQTDPFTGQKYATAINQQRELFPSDQGIEEMDITEKFSTPEDVILPNENTELQENIKPRSFIESVAEQREPQRYTLKEKELNNKEYKDFVKKERRPEAKSAQSLQSNIDIIKKNLNKFETGFGGSYKLRAKQLGELIGIGDKASVAAGESIEKASNDLVRDLGKTMGGVLSDKDILFLSRSVPGLSLSSEGNKQILNKYQKVIDRIKEYNQASKEYFRKFGNITDFDSDWMQYAEDNPIFEEQELNEPIQEYSLEDLLAEKKKRAGVK